MDNKNVTIYLKNKGYLELANEFPVPLTYNIADVKDISSKNGSYSKTIKLPATKINNELLGNLFNINIEDSTFDINRKVECIIVANDIVVMDGYFKLVSVDKEAKTQTDDEELMYYNAQVFDEATNFYDTLGDALLEDLDFSQYNHIYSASTVLGSSAHTAANIWTYPMLYNGDGSGYYQIEDFYPAIYAKAYVDKIFQDSEYSYESDFLEGTTYDGLFTKLIIPFNQERPQNTQEVIDGRKFRATMTGATDPLILSGLSTSTTISKKLPFNDDSSEPNFDNGDDYVASASTYVSNNNQITDFRVRFPATFKVYSESGVTLTNSQGIAPPTFNASAYNYKYKPRVGIFVNGVLQSAINIVPGILNSGLDIPRDLNPGLTTIAGYNVDVTFTNIQLNIGDEVEARVLPTVTPSNSYNGFIPGTPSPDYYRYYSGSTQVDPYFYIEFDINSSADTLSFINQPHQTDITDGDTIYLNNYIPKNVKQKDFFRSLVQMFNLYIEPDKDNDNKLIIKTRDEFYDTDEFVDWTDKFAIDRPNNIKFLPELQNRDLVLSYKSGSDVWNKRYQDNWKENFGRKKYIFDNDYLKGEKKIEVIFEPTPLIENGIGLITPTIPSEAPKTGIKILYKPDEWIEGSWDFKARDDSNQVVTYSLSGYPYAGHFDRPSLPTVDINFGEAREMFYWQYGSITDNNLSNRFYDNYVQGIIDGKMLTGYFDLNEVDIFGLDFSRRVFVDDTYYIINKIIDYNPMSAELTKVELIKIDTSLKFNTTNNNEGGTVRPTINEPLGPIIDLNPNNPNNPGPVKPWTTTNWPRKTKGNIVGNGNISNNDTAVDIVGNDNTVIGEGDGVIYGDNNYMFSERMFVYGNNNVATADTYYRSFIVGDNNTIQAQKTIVLGDGFTANTDNRTYIDSLDVRGTVISGFLNVSGATITGLDYLPLSGGVMTGGITGTTLQLTGITTGTAVSNVAIDASGNLITGLVDNDVFVSGSSGDYSVKHNNPAALSSDDYTFAFGTSSATTEFSVAMGRLNISSGSTTFIHGDSNASGGQYDALFGGQNRTLGNYGFISGFNNEIGDLTNQSSILGGTGNKVLGSVNRSAVIGGQNITATTSDNVFVPGLNIRDIGAGSPVINLGLDANGFVVTGTTGGSGSTPSTATTYTDFTIALSDETTQITTGTPKVTIYAPYDFTITGVKATLSESGSTSSVFDVVVNGTSIFGTKVTVDAGDYKSVDATFQPVISLPNVSEDDKVEIDIETAGTGAAGAKIYILGTRVITESNPVDIMLAVSDETTAITSGAGKITMYAPYAFTLSEVKTSLTTSGSTTTSVDVNLNGSSVFVLGSPISISSGSNTANSTSIATSSFAEDDRITIDIDAAGTDATGLKVYLLGTRT
jgi:hypothetical protein